MASSDLGNPSNEVADSLRPNKHHALLVPVFLNLLRFLSCWVYCVQDPQCVNMAVDLKLDYLKMKKIEMSAKITITWEPHFFKN